jgi:hypothetical protein
VIYVIKYSGGFRYFISHNIKISLKTRQHYYSVLHQIDTLMREEGQNSRQQLTSASWALNVHRLE